MTRNETIVIAEFRRICEIVKIKYGVDLSHTAISFNLKGRAAGIAQYNRRTRATAIRFNKDMVARDAFDHVLKNTIPHEIAHVVCYLRPELGSGHNAGWQRVCLSLGGSAERCHQEEVVFGRGYTYEYITSIGNTVRIGDKHHRSIRMGRSLNLRAGNGFIGPNSEYSIVGLTGRSFTNPIKVKVAA